MRYTEENFMTFLETQIAVFLEEYNKIDVKLREIRSGFKLFHFPQLPQETKKSSCGTK